MQDALLTTLTPPSYLRTLWYSSRFSCRLPSLSVELNLRVFDVCRLEFDRLQAAATSMTNEYATVRAKGVVTQRTHCRPCFTSPRALYSCSETEILNQSTRQTSQCKRCTGFLVTAYASLIKECFCLCLIQGRTPTQKLWSHAHLNGSRFVTHCVCGSRPLFCGTCFEKWMMYMPCSVRIAAANLNSNILLRKTLQLCWNKRRN